jgi:two-component system, cell cycle sensor histidine kinase and response regulator CckA
MFFSSPATPHTHAGRRHCHRRAVALLGFVITPFFLVLPGANAQSAGLTAASSSPPATDAMASLEVSKTLVVGVFTSSYPYMYLDDEGRHAGFATEVTDAVARVMKIPIKRLPVSFSGVKEADVMKRVDFLQFWAETPARREVADFSVPILRLHNTVVVRKGDTRIRRLADLEGRSVAVGAQGSVGEIYLREQRPGARIIHTDSTEKILRMLSSGECDAAIMTRLTARAMAERLRIKNIAILEEPIDGYDTRYAFAVHKDDVLLLARLNEGLAILHRSGEFDEIRHRWFRRYESLTFTREQFISYVAAALAIACAAITWGFLRQRTLSRHVARQAHELLQQRSLLGALYDNIPVAMSVLEQVPGRGVRVVSINREAGRLFGLDPVASAGRLLLELSLNDEYRSYFEQAAMRWPEPDRIDHREVPLPASQHLLDTTLVSLAPSDAGGARMCLLSLDVTKRRLADKEVAQTRRLRALGELVGGIAHEFNNLLTPIMLKTSVLQAERQGDAALQADIGVIEQASRRAAELTRRLLTFGRRSDERVLSVRLDEGLASCFDLLRPTVDRRIVWEIHIPNGLPPAGMNPTDLNQVVFNLVINARDTLLERLGRPDSPDWVPRLRVVVTALPSTAASLSRPRPGRSLTGWQRVTVEDNGEGIAPENVERVFEPFFTTKEAGKGTGLGLAMVWHLVTDAGGHVHVESRVGHGTRVHVTLPVWDAVAAGAPGPLRDTRSGLRGEAREILMVEDEPLVARAALSILQQRGHRVTHIADGAAAWAEFCASPARYDLLLVDINLPGMSGVDLVARVRQAAYAGPIIVMSGRVAEKDLRMLERLRVNHVMPKPFSVQELTEAVNAHGASKAENMVKV